MLKTEYSLQLLSDKNISRIKKLVFNYNKIK